MQKIVITGASSGMGKALKEYYQSKGDKVYNISLEEADFNCDVTDRTKMEEAFKDIKNKFQNIDMLINCAGFGASGAIELTPIEKAQSVFDVNIIGTINAIQLALPLMGNKGKIINFSSAMGLFPIPYRAFYGASKSAIISLTDSLRLELCQTNIQVTAVCPSDIKTNFTKNRIKNFDTNDHYGKAIELSTLYSDNREDKRMSLEKATKILVKWINRKKLKPIYIMTFKYKLLYFAKGFLPKSWYLAGCNKVMKKRK